MKIFGWIVWVVIVWLCVSSILSYRSGRAWLLMKNPNPTVPVISKVVLIIAILFIFTNWSKLHLIWIYPVVSVVVGIIWPKKYQKGMGYRHVPILMGILHLAIELTHK